MNTLKSLIFDLDGTLIDSLPGIQLSAQAAADQALGGRRVPDLRPHIGPPVRIVLSRALGISDAATLDVLEAEFRRSYDSDGWRNTAAFPTVPELLRDAAGGGIDCFVVTNKPALSVGRILHRLKLSALLREVVCKDPCQPCTKSVMLGALLERRRIDAAGALMVGDSDEDALAAEENGLRFVAAAYGYGRDPGAGMAHRIGVIRCAAEVLRYGALP
jgi:phosphoglycolate phosphatase